MRASIFILFSILFLSSANGQNVFGFKYYTNEQDTVIVTSVLKNSPADKAGLKVGDFLNFINDIPFTFKKKDVLAKILSDAPISNNKLRFYRNPDVKEIIIDKAPFSSFEFTCISENCYNGPCVIQAALDYTIKGTCSNNTISGQAECFYANGNILYKGELLQNKFEGQGIIYYMDKSRHEGTFKNGQRNGNGTYYLKDNSYIKSTWVNDIIEGKAEFYNKNNELVSNQVYKNGKLESETKVGAPTTNNNPTQKPPTAFIENSNTSKPPVSSFKKATKNPSLVKGIIDNRTSITAWDWKLFFFNDKYELLNPLKQKPPFTQKEIKSMATYAELSPDKFSEVIDQCDYENWPSFYKQHPDVANIFKFAFRNLKVKEVLRFKSDKDIGEYGRYGEYSIIYIADAENKHAPKELLSDDGIGFFMCIKSDALQDFSNERYNYQPFTLDKPFKGGGFGNWASKKQAFLFDMKSIEDRFENPQYKVSNNELKTALGLTEVEFQKLKDLCDVKYRPEGLKTQQQIIDAQRNAYFVDMKAYEIMNLGTVRLIFVPKNENYFMPTNMQPQSSEGWYFCTSGDVATTKPDESYTNSIKATTDIAMERYRKEQADREAQMLADERASAIWRENNKYKGVFIIHYQGNLTNYDRSDDEFLRVISVFGPPNQYVLEEDRITVEETYKSTEWKMVNSIFKENMDETQAIKYLTDRNFDRYSINTNYSYTIPKRASGEFAAALRENEEALKKIQLERDRLYKELMESNSDKKMEQAQNAMMDILNGKNPDIAINTKIEIIALDPTDKNYKNNAQFIGKQGITTSILKSIGDGNFAGIIEFKTELGIISFEKVKVKIIP